MPRQRVVVTGLGGICSLGTNATEIWTAMAEGRRGIGPIESPILRPTKILTVAEILELPDHGMSRRQTATMDRFSLLAVIAANEALAQSGLVLDEKKSLRTGAVIGTGICGWYALEKAYNRLLVEERDRVEVLSVPLVMPGAPAGQVSMVNGIRGPVFGVTSACSSSNHAITSAVDLLRSGRADAIVAGGTDAPIIWGVLKAWEALRVVSPDACSPFSADRKGLTLGEGAGAAVLETYESATRRGADILAEIVGVGMTADATDIVAPTKDGPTRAMQLCLEDAGLNKEQVHYINAHGTGTKMNDRIEVEAMRAVFGDHATDLSVSSTKSMHGHCLGASGALEMIACVNAVRHGIVPPTINYNEPDPDCDLDVTPNEARERTVDVAISNAFAFGGTNATVAVRAI